MPRVLVVEDSMTQLRQIQLMLQKAGYEVDIAYDGEEGLKEIARRAPDVVLTDMQMPNLDGLELVEAIRSKYPSIPVILMTAEGSEEVAVQSLQRGAANYVNKKNLSQELVDTVAKVLSVASGCRVHHRIVKGLVRTESQFELENDPSLIDPLVARLEEDLSEMELCDATGLVRISTALRAALSNAIERGNLELDSELRRANEPAYRALENKRRAEPPYRDRRVHVTSSQTRSEARYIICDDGPGFDPSRHATPGDSASLHEGLGTHSSQGLLLIRAFMDEVSHNPRGNEITLVKRRDVVAGL